MHSSVVVASALHSSSAGSARRPRLPGRRRQPDQPKSDDDERAPARRQHARGCASLSLLAGDDEGEDEAEERQGLGEGDAEEHGRADHAGGLGLAGHGRDGVADHDADADAGADGGAAVDDAATDGREAVDELARLLLAMIEDVPARVSPSCFCDQCSGCMAPPMYTAVRIVKMKACRNATRTSKPVRATSRKSENGQMTIGDVERPQRRP